MILSGRFRPTDFVLETKDEAGSGLTQSRLTADKEELRE
jgi:hypothetical protein